MREILFRGKRVDNGEWAYGSLLQSEISTNGYCECTIVSSFAFCNDIDKVDVHPESVGQFTGLLDKNGKKIFEGDVVMAPDYSKGLAITYKQPMKKITVEYRKGYKLTSGVDFRGVEIIGNIHDNPELL